MVFKDLLGFKKMPTPDCGMVRMFCIGTAVIGVEYILIDRELFTSVSSPQHLKRMYEDMNLQNTPQNPMMMSMMPARGAPMG